MNFSYMFNKKNYILFAILIILAGGTYLYTVPFQQWQQKRASGNETNFLRNVQMSAVDKIEVTDTAGKIFTITKSNDTWFLQPDNWPAEKTLTDTLEEKMATIASGDLKTVSINPDNKASFGITDTAMKTKFFTGDRELGSFIIGNIASDYQSTYIGRENYDKTYNVKETLTRAFDVESWRDRTITNVEPANIDMITLTYPSQQIELTNKPVESGEAYWRATKPYVARLQKDKIDTFLNTAAKLEASDIPAQDVKDTGLETPALQVILQGAGVDIRLSVSAKDASGMYFLREETSGRIYLISQQNHDELFKQIRDFQ